MRKIRVIGLGVGVYLAGGCSVGPVINYKYNPEMRKTGLDLKNVRSVLLEDKSGRKIGIQGQGERINLYLDIEGIYRITVDSKYNVAPPRVPGKNLRKKAGTLTVSRD